jgi:hypothetical protein
MKKNLLMPDLNKKIWDGTYSALKSLIESCYYSQIAFHSLETMKNNELAWWKEYCTIKMSSSRRSGHSTVISKVIPEYFDRALILSFTQNNAERILKSFMMLHYAESVGDKTINGELILKQTKTKIVTESSEYDFGSVNCLDNYQGIKYQAIVVDTTCLLSAKTIEAIYTKLGGCMNCYPQKFFIFMQ